MQVVDRLGERPDPPDRGGGILTLASIHALLNVEADRPRQPPSSGVDPAMSNDPAPRRYRILAIGLGIAVLGWQLQ